MNFKNSFLKAGACLPFMFTNAEAIELGRGFNLDVELTAVSDYRDKGVSQTQGDPALQAGLSLSSPLGVYAGVWVSSVDFGTGLNTRREQDYYVGWYLPITDNLSLDIGILKYDHPKSSSLNQTSSYGTLSYKGFELSYQYTDDLNGDQSASYTTIGYLLKLDDSSRLKVRYGIVDSKNDVFLSGNGDRRSRFNEWDIGAEKDLWGITWKASFVDTDLSKTECYNKEGYNDLCSGTIVLGAEKHF